MAPRVSLCIPTYRRAEFLGETIASALAQTSGDFEIIVVDDNSPDNTRAVVCSFDDARIRYICNEQNRGVPENLNYALSLGSGEYLVLLEDHDILEPTYVEETASVLDRHQTVGFVATGLIDIDEVGNAFKQYVGNFSEKTPGRELLRYLLRRMDCPFSVTAMMRRATLEEISPWFDGRYGWYADQALWLRLLARSDFGYVSKLLLRFRTREADHYLADKFWETAFCLDRLHRDNWALLHPTPTLASLFDRLAYETAKISTAAGMAAGKRLRREGWSQFETDSLRQYLSASSRLAVKVIDLLPTGLLTWVRSKRNATRQRLYGLEGASFGNTPDVL